jgi:hypothetical protein
LNFVIFQRINFIFESKLVEEISGFLQRMDFIGKFLVIAILFGVLAWSRFNQGRGVKVIVIVVGGKGNERMVIGDFEQRADRVAVVNGGEIVGKTEKVSKPNYIDFVFMGAFTCFMYLWCKEMIENSSISSIQEKVDKDEAKQLVDDTIAVEIKKVKPKNDGHGSRKKLQEMDFMTYELMLCELFGAGKDEQKKYYPNHCSSNIYRTMSYPYRPSLNAAKTLWSKKQ